jgi:hypothetical protein
MNKEDADQESFCSDSDDAGTSDSNTVALRQASTRGLLCAQKLEMADVNTRNSVLTAADNRCLSLYDVTVQQVHTFVAQQAGLI